MFWKIGIYMTIGALAGLGLQRLIGCPTGTCPLMRTPFTSMIYGAIMGLLFGLVA